MTTSKIKVLVVDDEAPIRRLLQMGVSKVDYDIIEAETGGEALRAIATHNPDAVVLDLGLPDIDGIEVIKKAREWSAVPIIVLSARGQDADKINALNLGADDYLTKPFSLGELEARIKVILRRKVRSNSDPAPIFTAGRLEIDYVARTVKILGEEIHLTPLEYKLLTILSQNAGRVMTHKQLLSEVWGQAFVGQNHYLRGLMKQLRHKIEAEPSRPQFLTTDTGIGYRFRLPE